MKRILRILILIAVAIAILAIWEKAASVSAGVRFFISSPSSAIGFAANNYQALRDAAVVTTVETVVGFVLAVVFCFVFMLLCLYWPGLLKAVLPVLITSQILPMITLAPLFIVLFGMGLLSKIAMVVLMCFFPIFINFSAGVKSVSPNILGLLYVYNTGRTFRIFRVLIPLSLPNVFVGLKVSTTMAVMGAIVAEFMGARDGLGKNLYLAPKNSQPELMICSIVLVVILGFLFFKSISFLERRICKWQNQTQEISI